MMVPKRMEEALNAQINHEFQSAYLYLAMSAYCETKDQYGFAQWLRAQAREEVEHAMKFFAFMNDRGGHIILDAIAKPPSDFGSLEDLFQKVLEHEVKVTALIHDLYELAQQEKDYASIPLLQWFISEQVEEEKSAADVVALLKQAGQDNAAVMQLDQRLGQRTA